VYRAAKARAEVIEAMLRASVPVVSPPPPDALRPADLPSVKHLGDGDRVIAEIDQDGYAFAVHPADEALLNRRQRRIGRIRYGLTIVIRRGEVVVAKQFTRGAWLGQSVGHYLFGQLHVPFFNEATALVRLRRVAGVPRLRHIDLTTHTLYLDYIHGETLQTRMAERGAKILDADVNGCGPRGDDEPREALEIASYEGERETRRPAIADLFSSILEAGVAPLDIKLGNIVVGHRTGAHYWVDFEVAHVASWPGYENSVTSAYERVERWFGVTRSDVNSRLTAG